MILIVGGSGNMGSRYKACLDYLKEPNTIYDVGMFPPLKTFYDKIIIATPTHTHLSQLEIYAPEEKDILVEKPIVKSLTDLVLLEKLLTKYPKISMVNQYQYNHLCSDAKGSSTYNYYRHGDDGLLWDCIQIIALATGSVTIKDDSPFWRCTINGVQYLPGMMDYYYVAMLKDFIGLKNYIWGPEKIIAAHEKVLKYEKNINRDTSKVDIN